MLVRNTGATTDLCTQSLTTQEFIFNEYIQICPDIIYHMSIGVYDISRYNVSYINLNTLLLNGIFLL